MADIRLSFNGISVTQPIVRMQHMKSFGKHSLCVLDVAYGRSLAQNAAAVVGVPEWTPAVLDFSNGAAHTERWYGYVHTSAVVSDNRITSGPGSVLRYTLMGTSLPLNQQRTRAWSNTTDSGVVRAIAREHRLRSVVQRTPEVVPYIPQTGESDWRVLKARAERNGYRLYVDGSTVLFVDPTLLLTGTRSLNIQSYQQNSATGSPDTLVKWTATMGSMAPREGGPAARHVANGLDQRTKRVITASTTNVLGGPVGTPVLTQVDTSKRLGGVAQAAQAAEANALNSRGWNTAVAVVSGSPGKQPGDVVEIRGNNIPSDQQGLWLVTGATHRLINDGSSLQTPFLTDLALERDKYYSPTFNTSFRTISTRDTVPAIIRNGAIWESETLEDVRVG